MRANLTNDQEKVVNNVYKRINAIAKRKKKLISKNYIHGFLIYSASRLYDDNIESLIIDMIDNFDDSKWRQHANLDN